MTTTQGAPLLAHSEATFTFTLEAPTDVVAPLFGAHQERLWASDWDPRFLHPVPAADREGMVFTVAHPEGESVWVNTRFDLAGGLVQYTYVLPAVMATRITIRIAAKGRQTQVDVRYDRTALRPENDDRVRRLSEADRDSGPEWKSLIDAHLQGMGH